MLDISQLSKRSGLPASKLRYYEEKGLIQSIGRSGLKRTFETSVLERLALIALGRAAGFSLDEISEMFTQSQGLHIDRDKLLAKADDLDHLIQKLVKVRDDLRHTAACPAPSHLECPNFRRVMKAAGLGLLEPVEVKSLGSMRAN